MVWVVTSIHNIKKTIDALALTLGDLPPDRYAGRLLRFAMKADGRALKVVNRYLGEFGPCDAQAGELVQYPALWVISMVMTYGLSVDDLVDEKFSLPSEEECYHPCP